MLGDIKYENQVLQQLLEEAKEIGEIAESEAEETEKNGTVSENFIAVFKKTQLPHLLLPKQYGGPQINLRSYSEIVETVSKYSVSAGWLTYLYTIHNVWAAYLPEKGKNEIINHGGLLADIFSPVGRAEPDGDGFRLTGKYNFVSGILYSDWVALAAFMKLPGGEEPEFCAFALPIEDVEVVENWNTMGLRGTGSNQVIADNAYIPEHRLLRLQEADKTGRPPEDNGYDADYPFYDVPFFASFMSGFSMVALGGAKRLLEEFKNRTEKRVRLRGQIAKESRHQGVLAELNLKYFEAEGLLKTYISMLENYEVTDEDKRPEFAALRGRIVKICQDIAVKVLATLGGNALFRGDPVELFVRDLLAVSAHRSNLYEDNIENYGKSLFGFESKSLG